MRHRRPTQALTHTSPMVLLAGASDVSKHSCHELPAQKKGQKSGLE